LGISPFYIILFETIDTESLSRRVYGGRDLCCYILFGGSDVNNFLRIWSISSSSLIINICSFRTVTASKNHLLNVSQTSIYSFILAKITGYVSDIVCVKMFNKDGKIEAGLIFFLLGVYINSLYVV
jgi:hypothetical protein